MSETRFRKYLAKGLNPFSHIIQVENSYSIGHPDTNYCIDGYEGNIELKYIKKWPVRANTIVKIDHYTKGQRAWIFKRAMALGSVFLFVKIENEYFLFSPFVSIEKVGITLNKEGFYKNCIATWNKRIHFDELIEKLKRWNDFRVLDKSLLKKAKGINFE